VRATFLGALPAEQVRECLDQTRVFCLPSITADNGDAEGLGIVILEAQAAGVPVITSARGGAQEGIVHGKTGFAHAEKDVAALRAGLVALLENDELAEQFGRRGREHVIATMDIASCNQQLEELYEQHAFGTTRHAGASSKVKLFPRSERQCI
jgi:glycosyltransferase involved in cell wall biosynthesis